MKLLLKPFADSVQDGPDGYEICTAGPSEDDWIAAHKALTPEREEG